MIDPAPPHAEPPVTLDELSAALDSSVLASATRRVWRSVVAAADQSRVKTLVANIRASFVDEESVVSCAGIVVATAMAVHLLLLTAQPYPFPGHSTYWLPGTLLVAGGALLLLRRPIAAAWRDRKRS